MRIARPQLGFVPNTPFAPRPNPTLRHFPETLRQFAEGLVGLSQCLGGRGQNLSGFAAWLSAWAGQSRQRWACLSPCDQIPAAVPATAPWLERESQQADGTEVRYSFITLFLLPAHLTCLGWLEGWGGGSGRPVI